MTDHDLLPLMDEAELRALLDRTLSGVQAPPRLQASAVTAGRRLRMRRRAGKAVGGLLAAAACTAAVATGLGGGSGTADSGYAGDPSPTVVATPTPDQEQGIQDDQAPGWWDMPSRRMLGVLRDVLPDGVTVTESERHLEGTTERTLAIGSLHGLLAGPTGPGAFQIILYPPAANPDHIGCRDSMTSCEPLLDIAGAPIGRVSTDREGGTTYHEVMLLGPDGGALYFYVGDSSGEKPGYEPPSADAPPLSADQLVAMAQHPAWTGYEPAG